MKLLAKIDPRRDREGTLTLLDATGKTVIGPVPVCGTADEALAKAQQNPSRDALRPGGHPPFGRYRLAKIEGVEPRGRWGKGPNVLAFEPESGDALRAESFGRLLLELHGGAPGPEGMLRATGGGLRVSDEVIQELAARLEGAGACELELLSVKESWWSRLFRRRRVTDDDGTTGRSDSSWSSSSSESRDSAYSGRGGDFGGAGASGSWDAAPAGRAAAQGAAVAAGAAIGAAAALAASESGTADDSGAGESGAADSSSDSTTSTNY